MEIPKMTYNETMLVVELLLKDIRADWSYGIEERLTVVQNLVVEWTDLIGETDLLVLLGSMSVYAHKVINDDSDGRYFKCSYPKGYENMNSVHGLSYTYEDKSSEFKKYMELLHCDDDIFLDK